MMIDKQTILNALARGEINMQGQFLAGSNYTFLVDLTHESLEMKAVYKPIRGEQPLWDFPGGTLAKREVAAFVVSEALGWDLVPPTVYRKKAPLGAGSLQQYIEHEPHIHYFNFDDKTRQRLRPVALFDLIANNADRKGGHILVDEHDHLWLIDHGICFHADDKLRTVVWDFAGEEIPPDLMVDLCRFADELENGSPLVQELHNLLHIQEIDALLGRTRQITAGGRFPYPQSTRRSYPWPPV